MAKKTKFGALVREKPQKSQASDGEGATNQTLQGPNFI